jgi:hypothetical protein
VFTKTENRKVGTAVLNRHFSSENPASATR